MDYSGKIIKKTPVVPSQTSASGVWTLDEALQATKSNTWPVANVPDPISRSLRFRRSASAYLNRTPATAGNRKTWTWSGWVKRGSLGTQQKIFTGGNDISGNYQFGLYWDSSNALALYSALASADINLVSSSVYRDPSAWYHIVVALDTTQATSTNRVKIYVNGVQITSFSSSTYPSQNNEPLWNSNIVQGLMAYVASAGQSYADGYLTEVHNIDGQALTPSSFGGTNAVTGVWEPRQYTGTYGTNGFLLTFSDNTSTTTLGNDTSGNSNNWTTNNISLTAGSTYDSMLDVPTQWIGYNTGDVASVTRGNYCTLNPLFSNATLSNANLNFSGGSSGIYTTGTIAPTSGKFYWEVVFTTIAVPSAVVDTGIESPDTSKIVYYKSDGSKGINGTETSYGASYTTNDVIGVAVDLDSQNITFYKNNTSQGTFSFSSASWTGEWMPYARTRGTTTYAGYVNFGQRPFSYTPPAGFLSLCTTNLSSPTILQGNQYFDATTYTGNDVDGRLIANSGSMQPSFVWVKARNQTYSHTLYDAIRGGANKLSSNSTDAEATNYANGQVSFQPTGFNAVAGSNGLITINETGTNYVAWSWAGNGTGSSNTDGSITSTVSANTTAGFSIVTYTGNGVASATVGHGLGVAPAMIITKVRSTTESWAVYHQSLASGYYIELNGANAASNTNPRYPSAPSSTVVTIGSSGNIVPVNENGSTYVMYAFAAVAGYSAFGSYTGNGSSDGTFVYTGFRPEFVLVKCSSNGSTNWVIVDSTRNTYNVTDLALQPNLSDAEQTGSSSTMPNMDLLSNGFKLRTTSIGGNGSGYTYIYYAVAESPFKNALAR